MCLYSLLYRRPARSGLNPFRLVALKAGAAFQLAVERRAARLIAQARPNP
jgi:hypothetical protein